MHEPERRREILGIIDTNRFTSFKDIGEQEDCSNDTVRRIAAEDGLHRQVMRRAPHLGQSAIAQRLRWIQENLDRDWKTILWTDEVPLTIGKDPRRRWVTRRVGEEYRDGFTVPAVPQGKQVMAWGVIGYNYKGPLFRFDLAAPTPLPLRYATRRPIALTAANGINSVKYAEWILAGPLLDAVEVFRARGVEPLVMEDGAGPHRGEYCDYMRRDLRFRRLFHPPYSPDLNPIENAWMELQSRLADFPRATNGDALWAQAEIAWDAIPMEYVNTLVESMPRRLLALQDAAGGETKY